jgi:hypothetical protein
MTQTKLILITILLAFVGNARAQLTVHDTPVWLEIAKDQAQNIIEYVTIVGNTAQTVANQEEQIRRFGDPRDYVQMLDLDPISGLITQLKQGIDGTIADYREASDGTAALGYVANGLYSNLQGRRDRWGNAVAYQPENFKKFGVLQSMTESYSARESQYNAQMNSLQQQLQTAMQNLNAASTQMASEKYTAEVDALTFEIDALSAQTSLAGQRLAVQQLSNRNNAAREAEADQEQAAQEHRESLQNEAKAMAHLIAPTL